MPSLLLYLDSACEMTVLPQPKAPGMAHVPAKGNAPEFTARYVDFNLTTLHQAHTNSHCHNDPPCTGSDGLRQVRRAQVQDFAES